MNTKVNANRYAIHAEERNKLYAEGYRYYCSGDYRVLDSIDPWSGMPNVDSNTYFFDNKEEAEAFAEKQIWVFNHDVHAEVYDLPKHTETWEEFEARKDAERAERKAKRIARETKKAQALGMTLEVYKQYVAKKAEINRLRNAVAALKVQLAGNEAELEILLKEFKDVYDMEA